MAPRGNGSDASYWGEHKSVRRKSNAIVVGTGSVVGILALLNIFFIQRLVATMDNNTLVTAQAQQDIAVLKYAVKTLSENVDDLRRQIEDLKRGHTS